MILLSKTFIGGFIMNIFCLIPRLTYTGAPKILAWLSNQLVKYGHTVTIVTIFKHEQFQELDEKIKIINLDFNQGDTWIKRNTIEMIKILYAFHKYVKKDKPDIIISFLDSVGLSYLFVNKLFGNSKMIVSERTDPYSGKKITAPLKKLLVSFADYVVFQTDGSMKFYDKKTQNKGS